MIRWVLVLLLAGCGAKKAAPPPSRDASASAPQPSDGGSVLAPELMVVVLHRGLFTVIGEHEVYGVPTIELERGDERATFARDDMKVYTRPLIDRDEAERRVRSLTNAVPAVIKANPDQRRTIYRRTVARGSDEQLIDLLRILYVLPWAPDADDLAAIDALEHRIADELAIVLGVDRAAMIATLHAPYLKGQLAAFAPDKPPRPAEPASPLLPADPYKIEGHVYVGSFELQGDKLLVGDPLGLYESTSARIALFARAGTWHCYADDASRALVAVHADVATQLRRLRAKATQTGVVDVSTSDLAIADDQTRDDAALMSAVQLGVENREIAKGRACVSAAADDIYAVNIAIDRDGIVTMIAIGPREP